MATMKRLQRSNYKNVKNKTKLSVDLEESAETGEQSQSHQFALPAGVITNNWGSVLQ